MSHAAGRGGVRARGRLKGLKVTPSCGEESWHLREQAASRQRARKQEPSRSDKQRTQADSPRGSESSERVRSARPLLHRKSPGVGEVSWSLRFLFREELFNEETSLGKQVPPPGPANPKTSPTKNSRTDHQRVGEETSLVKRVPPPGPANPKTSPTKNRRTDQQRSVVPRCVRTLGDFG